MSYGGTREAWLVGAARTPIGRHGGAMALEALIERTDVPPGEVEDVYFGCACASGSDRGFRYQATGIG